MEIITNLFRMFFKDSIKYTKIKNENPNSKYFGIVGIVYPILALILGGGAIYFSVKLLNDIGGFNNIIVAIFIIIGGAALGIGGALGFFSYVIRGIIVSSYQIKLHKKTIGVVALIVNFLILCASIVLLFYIIKHNL